MEGNQMKMREALLKLRAEIGLFYNNEWIPYDAWQGCDDMISHALSESPRNCDIYKTSGDADREITKYCSKMAETGECVKSCPYRESEGGCAFGWILASAGTKGEGDENN